MNIRSSRCRKIVSLSTSYNAEFMNRPSNSYYNDEKTVISASDVSSDECNESSDEWLPLNSKEGNEIETDSDNSFNNKDILDKIENDNAIVFEQDTLQESDVELSPVKRHVSEQVRKAKEFSKMYTFSLNSLEKVRVCKQFFLKTLAISHGPVDKAFEGLGSENGMFIKNDNRGKTQATNKTPSDVIYEIKSHIEKFPTIESHYCRATTKRKYLDPTLSIAKMYEPGLGFYST
ncbi:hypothetical protein QTP88_029248 [Uroleucon formosanum]